MSAPDQDAPFLIACDQQGVMTVEIVDHEGRVRGYVVQPDDAAEGWGVRLHEVGEATVYRVGKADGQLWRCDCPDRFRAKREARACKHTVAVRALKAMLNHLRPMESNVPKAKPDEKPAAAPRPFAELCRALADPFPPSAVGWKPQSVKGDRALAVAYIDARDVMDRLDAVVGVAAWRSECVEHADGTVSCTLSLKVDGEWIPKQDVGGESDQKDAGDRKKAAYSDALKRAAVHWGVGRYLYSLPATWADFDAKRQQFVRAPQLPAWALPGGSGRPPGDPLITRSSVAVPQGADEVIDANGTHAPEPPGPDFHKKLIAYDLKLCEEGLCGKGDLVRHVALAGKKAGFPADLTTWTQPQIDVAFNETKAFKAAKQAEARQPVAT